MTMVIHAATIAALKAEAKRLLNTVTEEPMKVEIGLAGRDLDEALWLQQPTTVSPAVLEMVELLIQLAADRLELIASAVQTDRPLPLLNESAGLA